MSESRLYIASLTDYNEGRLYGDWIELEGKNIDEIRLEIQAMLEASPSENVAEEYAIHDYEGFGSLKIHEYEDLETLVEVVRLSEQFGPIAFEVLANHGMPYREHVKSLFSQQYEGAWDSKMDWAEHKLKSIIALTGKFRSLIHRQFGKIYLSKNYQMSEIGRYLDFDIENWLRDVELGGYADFYELDGKVYVFWS